MQRLGRAADLKSLRSTPSLGRSDFAGPPLQVTSAGLVPTVLKRERCTGQRAVLGLHLSDCFSTRDEPYHNRKTGLLGG